MSVGDLAARSGLSTRFVTEIQADRGNVSIVQLLRLARALGTTASCLVAEAEAGNGRSARVIALLGVRGAGKSTIGARLAARLRREFFELDRLVEAEAGMPLAEIFATHGESYFRRLEVAALRRLLAHGVAGVVATGGGIVENDEASKLLEEQTTTVWLRATAEHHWQRVVRQGEPPAYGGPARCQSGAATAACTPSTALPAGAVPGRFDALWNHRQRRVHRGESIECDQLGALRPLSFYR